MTALQAVVRVCIILSGRVHNRKRHEEDKFRTPSPNPSLASMAVVDNRAHGEAGDA